MAFGEEGGFCRAVVGFQLELDVSDCDVRWSGNGTHPLGDVERVGDVLALLYF